MLLEIPDYKIIEIMKLSWNGEFQTRSYFFAKLIFWNDDTKSWGMFILFLER